MDFNLESIDDELEILETLNTIASSSRNTDSIESFKKKAKLSSSDVWNHFEKIGVGFTPHVINVKSEFRLDSQTGCQREIQVMNLFFEMCSRQKFYSLQQPNLGLVSSASHSRRYHLRPEFAVRSEG
ncbi:Uncharacterized protein Fot_35200 [Forsythia ovata]|uniref:Uncharacterized protein n=1 Tax=Forsythia ovata TaxID=205694 RepID=A0ABD1SNV2_9LAMI